MATSIAAFSSTAFDPNSRSTVGTETSAAAATDRMVVVAKPARTNSCAAAATTRLRVSCACPDRRGDR